jgi:uncharacterized membrane protein YoaK (UPF0700 family)
VASGQESHEAQRAGARRAFALAWVGGIVDAIGFLTLNRLFTAHMSGNSAALGDALIEVARRRGIRATMSVVLTLEAALLIAFRLYAGSNLNDGMIAAGATRRFTLLVALLAVPMGLQTSALQRGGGGTVHTTYITGMLTNLAKEVVAYLFWLGDRRHGAGTSAPDDALRHPSRARALLMAGIWGGFVGGATTGGVAVTRWGLNAVVAPLLLLGIVIALDVRRRLDAPLATWR